MSPKPCRPQPHSKVPGQSLESHRGPVSHHILFGGCSGRSGVTLSFSGWGRKGSLVSLCSCRSFVSTCCPLSADLLFGVPGKYSGVSLYTRKRLVSYTITLVFQHYHAK